MGLKTPVVLFLFRRHETLPAIFDQIRSAKPSRLYLVADGPRDEAEKLQTDSVRKLALDLADWGGEVIPLFAEENIGVYQNIGGGAKRVLSREKSAIFLEDDNCPAPTFFQYCEELLEYYESDERVLWICGTNYLENYDPPDGSSYMFTQHLLPCGWASWSDKFLASYDGDLSQYNDKTMAVVRESYRDQRLFRQEQDVIAKTRRLLSNSDRMASWDRQMLFSIRANRQYGISPSRNQIRNIGVDSLSTHGGNSLRKTMTNRFCEIPTHPMEFPLRHPGDLVVDANYDHQLTMTVLYPLKTRVLMSVSRGLKRCFGVAPDRSLMLTWRGWKRRLGAAWRRGTGRI